jgi:hypothetical protein
MRFSAILVAAALASCAHQPTDAELLYYLDVASISGTPRGALILDRALKPGVTTEEDFRIVLQCWGARPWVESRHATARGNIRVWTAAADMRRYTFVDGLLWSVSDTR